MRQALHGLALAGGEAALVPEPGVTGSLQFRPARLLVTANRVDRIVDDLDGMKLVEGDRGLRQMRGGSRDERRAHVDADLGDLGRIAAMPGQIIGEGADRSS